MVTMSAIRIVSALNLHSQGHLLLLLGVDVVILWELHTSLAPLHLLSVDHVVSVTCPSVELVVSVENNDRNSYTETTNSTLYQSMCSSRNSTVIAITIYSRTPIIILKFLNDL